MQKSDPEKITRGIYQKTAEAGLINSQEMRHRYNRTIVHDTMARNRNETQGL